MNLYCADCSTPHDLDLDECTHCDCGGKLIAASVHRARREAEADRIDRAWETYHASTDEPRYMVPGIALGLVATLCGAVALVGMVVT